MEVEENCKFWTKLENRREQSRETSRKKKNINLNNLIELGCREIDDHFRNNCLYVMPRAIIGLLFAAPFFVDIYSDSSS